MKIDCFQKQCISTLYKFFSFIFLSTLQLLVSSNVYSQYNQFGYPFKRNYSYKEYLAPGANVAMAMNSKGIMYFANASKGVIEYDGVSWRHIAIANNSQCKSLAVDSNDIVFVGSVGEIGYIAPDKLGNSSYYSLTNLVDTSKVRFTNVWKTYATPNGAYFCAFSHIFYFQFPNKLVTIELPNEAFYSFSIDNKIINGYYKQGLLELINNKMVQMQGVEPLVDQDIIQVFPFCVNEWLIITYKGLFSYNTAQKKVTVLNEQAIHKKTSSILSKSSVYNGCVIPQKGFAIATLDNGVFLSDTKANITENFNSSTGMQSSTVSDLLYNQNQGVLWATLDNGITRFEYNSPFRMFGKESNLNGTVLSVLRHDDVLYVGTFTGLSYLDYNENGIPLFKEIDELKGKFVYSLVSVPLRIGGAKMIAATSDDFFEIRGSRAYPLYVQGATAFSAYVSKLNEGTFYVGCSKGIYRVKWAGGKWNAAAIPESGKEIYSLFEDKLGNIWASTAIDGVLKISSSNDITTYTTKDGLPSNSDLRVYYLETSNKVIVTSRTGLYEYSIESNSFKPSSILNFPNNPNGKIINGIYDGFVGALWINNNNRLLKATPNDRGYSLDSITFKRLPEMSIESFLTEPNGITWICTSEGLISYNNNYEDTLNKSFDVLIRTVLTNDNLLFGGNYSLQKIIEGDTLLFPSPNQQRTAEPVLRYRNNNLTFTLASPFFHDESSVQFSYLLEGYNTSWSKWSNINRAVYTNLREGYYTFRVKAMNIYGHESREAIFSFSIKPPWYRTIWAFIAYAVLVTVLFVLAVKYYTRKLEADKKRLEGIVAERTAEVVKQKDEILEKNIEIEQKNKEITDSIVYAKRIQEALLPVKDQVELSYIELFVYFNPKDIVSGDFYFIRNIPSSELFFAAAADCTGHGVPGAFMSMLGISFLNELIAKPDIKHSDDLLNHLRIQVIESLNQKGLNYETKDGMDIALIVYNHRTNLLEFSGANNPLYHIRNSQLSEIKADKMPIGLHDFSNEPFTRHEIITESGDIVYMFSDGFVDQFGGEHGKKYMSKNFKEFLLSIHTKPMQEQETLIADEANRWRGKLDQVDDQVVIGVRFK